MIKIYGLIGYPLSHSFSEKYFTKKFEKEKITNCVYKLFPLEKIELLPLLIKENPDLLGMNVTIPYKESVIPFLDEIDPVAKTMGAVNCIRIGPDRKIKGYNTDAFGFRQSIKPFVEPQHERALILGTGGASKSVYHVLKEIGIDCYFASRKKKSGQDKIFTYEELNENMIKAFKLIINTTPLGMFPDISSYPPIPYSFISSSHLLYDLIYNPSETEFLKQGKTHGAATVNGLSMLYQQAEEAWRIWNK